MVIQNTASNTEVTPNEDPLVINYEDANLISLTGAEERGNTKSKAYDAIFKDSLNRIKQSN
jgi:hypothetical protein